MKTEELKKPEQSEESKLRDVLGEKFNVFEDTLKTYLKEQKVMGDWEEFISGLSLKLCVWSDRKIGEGVPPEDGQVPFMVSSSEANNLENQEDCGDKASYFYREVCRGYTDVCFDRICPDGKVCHSSSKDNVITGLFDVMWIISYKKTMGAVHEFIIKVILDFLKDCTDNLNMIEKADKDFWEKKAKEKEFNIIKKYIKRVFDEGMLPDRKTITRIAWKHYEKKENRSKMLFVEKEVREECSRLDTGILLFDKESHIEIGEGGSHIDNEEKKRKLTNIRKMLETCSKTDDKGCYLLVNNTKPYPLFGIITEDSFKELNNNKLDGRYWLIEFMGNGDWTLSKGKDPVLIYQRGEFLISQSQKEADAEKLVDELQTITKGRVTKEKEGAFKRILERVMKQKHGALLIISNDAETEAEILCGKFKRGTLVNTVDFSEEGNLPLLDGIAAVDGAVLVDFSGVCYGFGVILDGDAKVEGDVGRGARYNSALNYVAGKDRYAVVVSEDKENPVRIVDPKEKETLSRNIEKATSNK